jgi:type II secretory pathway pseudopilin PulG
MAGIALPEILMVILILGLVAATIIPRFVYSDETRSSECKSNVILLNAALDANARKGGQSPSNDAEFNRLILSDREHFPSGLPRCPSSRPYEYDTATGHVILHAH